MELREGGDYIVDMPPKSTKNYIMCPVKESKEYPYLVCCGECFKGWKIVKKHLDKHWEVSK